MSTTENSFQTAFQNLFNAFTGPIPSNSTTKPSNIGITAGKALLDLQGKDSVMLYAFGSNYAFFKSGSSDYPATCAAFAPGVIPLAGVSHLGTALASMIVMKLDDELLKENIQILLSYIQNAKEENNEQNWISLNPVFTTYAGQMVAMIDDGLNLVEKYLVDISNGSIVPGFDTLRQNVLNPKTGRTFNSVMIATFALANLINHYQVVTWLNEVLPDKDVINKMTVVISGSSGRATGGLSLDNNSIYSRFEAWAKKYNHSLAGRVFIAPGGPQFTIPSGIPPSPLPTTDNPNTQPPNPLISDWPTLLSKIQGIWWQTELAVQLSEQMFKDYPSLPVPVDISRRPTMSEFISYLKYVMGNPSQELASCTSGYMLNQLLQNDCKPDGLFVPGLSVE